MKAMMTNDVNIECGTPGNNRYRAWLRARESL